MSGECICEGILRNKCKPICAFLGYESEVMPMWPFLQSYKLIKNRKLNLFREQNSIQVAILYVCKGRRRKYETIQRDLINIEKVQKFKTKSDFINTLPNGLPKTFTNRDLAERLDTKGNKRRIQKVPGLITYSLCGLGILQRVGKRGREHEFSIQR